MLTATLPTPSLGLDESELQALLKAVGDRQDTATTAERKLLAAGRRALEQELHAVLVG